MDERYEIGRKLGQGGLGSVYQAHDTRMNRDVAIKRIFTGDDERQREEAIRQMSQETGTLAMLQHPHIVTIHDVGSDEDGPFVVMELLTGKTVDDVVEKAVLTWSDFREFALQVQEGLIAAQDLGLVHRDLKPTNLMLNWLPSGKFQVKIVDFGLAKFSPKPSLQTIDHGDSVYGSIFFMAPEQFERVPLDARCDMYAIGCVYYFALTGQTPFQGDTGPQVMASHLEHRVVPLHELRPDLPPWVCDWIMWHINRRPEDRPENAREALQSFLELDAAPATPPTGAVATSSPAATRAATGTRPKLIIPGTTPVQEAAEPAPAPVTPPASAPPSVHHATAAQPATPQGGNRREPVTGTADKSAPDPSAAATAPIRPGAAVTGRTVPSGKRPRSTAALTAVALLLLGLIGFGTYLLRERAADNRANERYNSLVREAADPSTEELMVSGADLDLLLRSIGAGGNQSRETVYKALAIATASDGTDVDATIAGFVTTRPLPPEIRAAVLTRVLRFRRAPETVPTLLEYAREAPDPAVSAAAVTAAAEVTAAEHLPALLDLLRFRTDADVRRAVENAIATILRQSPDRRQHAAALAAACRDSVHEANRLALLRLLGTVGGDQAATVVRSALEGGRRTETVAAIEALKVWPDDSMFRTLVDFMEVQTDEDLRRRCFDAAFTHLSDERDERDAGQDEELWKLLASLARSEREQLAIINGLVRDPRGDWVTGLLRDFTDPRHSERVVERASKGIAHLKEQGGH